MKFSEKIIFYAMYNGLEKFVNSVGLARIARKYLVHNFTHNGSSRILPKQDTKSDELRYAYIERARHFVNTLCNALDLSEWGTYRLIDNQSIRKYLFFIIIFACTIRAVYELRTIAFISRSRHYKLHICILAFRKNKSDDDVKRNARRIQNPIKNEWWIGAFVNWIRNFVLQPIEVKSKCK